MTLMINQYIRLAISDSDGLGIERPAASQKLTKKGISTAAAPTRSWIMELFLSHGQ